MKMASQDGFGGNIAAAIREWAAALDDAQVKTDGKILDRYARTTQADAPRPSCILHPRNTEEVQSIVRTASAHRVPVYPISRGRNWGYGDACAPTEGSAIIDLGQMNRILEVNAELAYCVIEPGVTQQQLYDYLQENDTGLWLDVSAAGPHASLVGNTLDRGFGHTRYGDHFQTCCGMEIVLADGRVLNTGFGRYENAKAARTYPYGVGPFLDGLFCQSNLGIVTRIGLWLMPEPETFTAFFFQVPRFEDLEELVDRLRPLRLAGILDSALHIGNDLRVISGSQGYPWVQTGGTTPLPEDVRMDLRRKTGAKAWQASGSITGTAAHARASRKALKKALRGFTKVRFVNDRLLASGERLARLLNAIGFGRRLSALLRLARPNFDLLKGIPVADPLVGAQWRLRKPPEDSPNDPLDTGCGLYWVSPVLPIDGAQAMALLELSEPILARYGFDMLVSFTLLNERSLLAIFNVSFDKSIEDEAQQASACYDDLVEAMMDGGYIIYRCGLQGMDKIREQQSTFWEVAAEIKQVLDPHAIIAPGRYIPPRPLHPAGPERPA